VIPRTHYRLALMLGLLWLGSPHALRAAETSEQFRIVGLFAPERQQDLREVLKETPEVQLVAVDLDNAEVTLRYDPAKLIPNFNPKKPPTAEQTLQRLNNVVVNSSQGSFRLMPRLAAPKEALTKVEIDVGILDCKACRFGAYRAVMGVDGVSRATVNASPSRVTAWIDARKTDRAALEKALTRVGVAVPAK
jgi:copper chaperone CopZ